MLHVCECVEGVCKCVCGWKGQPTCTRGHIDLACGSVKLMHKGDGGVVAKLNGAI